jgi:hypothetical protein
MERFVIMGSYDGVVEEIDSAKDEQEARYLTGEYQMAFTNKWSIWYEETGKTKSNRV